MNANENTFDMHVVNKLTIKEELHKIPLTTSQQPALYSTHFPSK